MIVGVPAERGREKRVAIVPRTVRQFTDRGLEVRVEKDAGICAGFTDADYESSGAKIVDKATLWCEADVMFGVAPPTAEELQMMRPSGAVIGFFYPHDNEKLLDIAAKRKVSVSAMDRIPRISVAQSVDALSAMANIAGYKAVITASDVYEGFLSGQITSAGRSDPAQVLVIGAGVAGLSAISTAKKLGAEVSAFDTRPEVGDQVKSVGGRFLTLNSTEGVAGEGGYAKEMSKEYVAREHALLVQHLPRTSIVITTALIPGRQAPRLITKEMVKSMPRGGVIVDLAAAQGGNCELTVKDELVEREGIKIVGYTDFPSRMARQASTLYSNNLQQLLDMLLADGGKGLRFDLDNKIISASLICHAGERRWPQPEIVDFPKPTPMKKKARQEKPQVSEKKTALRAGITILVLTIIAGGLLWVGQYVPPAFLSRLTVFVLACFVGWQVVWNVTPALHTPLMSVTNAISGIIILGAMVQLSAPSLSVATVLAVIVVFIAMVNVAGGFFVTWRMLRMFRK